MDKIEFTHLSCPKHFGEKCCPECEKEVRALVEEVRMASARIHHETRTRGNTTSHLDMECRRCRLEKALAPFRAKKSREVL